jgi:kynureninase
VPDPLWDRAVALDAADPLGPYRAQFLDSPGLVAYLDGNSLGRPLASTAQMIDSFVRDQWAGRLIRGWDEGWLDWPVQLGDRLGAAVLGAAAGQVVVADSTTVMLYKLARAAVDARPGRRQVVLDTDNFPTDRYVLEGIAAERGLELVWVETDPALGVTPDQVAAVVGEQTALVLFSHVAYRSGFIADAAAITAIAHSCGALAMWDLSHSVGSLPLSLDAWGVDLAVGCSYKYLNGGPGAPAFGYVRAGLPVQQPIWGWMGRRDPFEMGPGYVPADGIRSLLSGTPPILAMLPLRASLDLIEAAGMPAIRAKSVELTSYALDLADAWLVPLGAEVASPHAADQRGGHLTLRRAGFRTLLEPLWAGGVLPDYRQPDAIRIGLSPLSTSFAEVHAGLRMLTDLTESL